MPDLKALKSFARRPYTELGFYPLVAVTADGGSLCSKCVRSEYKSVYRSTRDNANDGWNVAAVAINWECPNDHCDHCGGAIESAYGDEN